MPLRPCPDCKTDVSTNASACPKCGHRFVPVKALLVAVGICGIGIIVCGAMMLESMSRLGIPIFGPVEKNEFTEVFDMRTIAYPAIALGIVVVIGCCVAWWRHKR